MKDEQKWKPDRSPAFLPNQAPIPAAPVPVRKRRKSNSRKYLPPAYSWVKIMAWLCLTFAGLILSLIIFQRTIHGWHQADLIAISVLGVVFMIPPVGVLLRKKWGFYLALVANFPLLLAFPVGTVIGFITIRALLESKDAFGIR